MSDPPRHVPSGTRRPLYFDAVLTPHRSLGPTGFWLLMGCLCAVCFAAGTTFTLLGAWPVFGFMGLEVALVYLAFRASYRGARLTETLRLDDRELEVRRVSPDGRERVWRFQPYWLRVTMDEPPRHDGALTLSSHGRHVAVGAFLAPEDRRAVADSLLSALARQRAALSA